MHVPLCCGQVLMTVYGTTVIPTEALWPLKSPKIVVLPAPTAATLTVSDISVAEVVAVVSVGAIGDVLFPPPQETLSRATTTAI